MIQLDFNSCAPQVRELVEKCEKMRPAPLRFYKYLKRVLDSDWDRVKPAFPMDIKIPKSNAHLIRGDYEPAYVIHLDKPIMMDDTPIWFNNSAKAANIRFGYKNLDAREICDLEFSAEYIHGFLGGSSGHGKSVTLNAMIGALCYEYAPWEIELHLSDAKITEFKKYGIGHRIPHIVSIAATEDADFVVSVLQRARDEMNERQKIFGNLSVSSLKSFRAKTGLAMPRVIIIMDEVESTFKLAGRQAQTISDLIDAFARLGRSAGYHIFMATQNMSSDIPKSAVGQIRIRCCLGATETVSQAVLGNSGAASNVGRIGRLITNTEVMNGGDTMPHNVKYQTPLIEDDEFLKEMEFLESVGQAIGYRPRLAFYDEEDVRTVEKFDKTIDKAFDRMEAAGEISSTAQPLILGLPSFVIDDKDELLKIWLDGKDIENIAICSVSSERVYAHLHNISKSLGRLGYVIQTYSDNKDTYQWIASNAASIEVRRADKPPLSNIQALVRKRAFLLQLESMAAKATYDREKVEVMFAAANIPHSSWGNELLCRRAVAFSALMGNNNKEWNDIQYLFPSFLEVYKEFEKSNCLISSLTPDNFKKAAFILGDMSKIVGYGRDPRDAYISVLKKAMQDACRVGVIFIIYSRSMDGLNSLATAVRYTIFDMPDGKDWSRMRAEEPRELKPVLALLFDNADSANPQRKFKRTLLRDELGGAAN